MNKVITLKEAIPVFQNVIQDLRNSVLATLGPNGKTIVIYEDDGHVKLTKDGVTVAESLYYDDALSQIVLNLLRESSIKTAAKVGDGTTTSMLLTIELLSEILNKKDVRILPLLDQIEESIDFIISKIETAKISIIDDMELLRGLILTSVNRDSELANLLFNIYNIIGKEGIVNVYPTQTAESYVEYVNGIGFTSKIVASPMKSSESTFNMDGVYIALVEGDIKNVSDIATLLKSEQLSKNGLLIVAKSFSKEVINVININNSRGTRATILIEAEGFSPTRLEILEDIALLLGTRVLSTDASTAFRLKGSTASELAKTKGLQIKNSQVILKVDSKLFEKPVVKTRIEELTGLLKDAIASGNLGQTRAIKLRLSKYIKIANLFIASVTSPKQGEILDRVDDAISAIKSAMTGGIVPGGGALLYRLGIDLMAELDTEGAHMVNSMCTSVLSNLINSTRLYMDLPKITKIMEKLDKDPNSTFDVVNEEVVDAQEAKIIDPANVLIFALNNAVSIIRTITNTNSFIIPDRNGEI